MKEITINLETPRQKEVLNLIKLLDEHQSSLYPAESNHLLDIKSLESSDVRFFVARYRKAVVGCGALKIYKTAGYGEVKRMFVDLNMRRKKIGKKILECIIDEAKKERLNCLRLETGIYQPEAISLYEKAGFTKRGPFGEYKPDPLSIFMEKNL